MKKISWKNMSRSFPVKNDPQLLLFNVFERTIHGVAPFFLRRTVGLTSWTGRRSMGHPI
jgi:hypothetical protein